MSHPIHLILSPGTRIVTRNDANRIGSGQLIPAGAVAVITDSPADAQHAYKVRFNDGAEAMLRRTEFSILKEFKGIPDNDERANPSSLSPGERAEVRAGDGSPRPSDGRGVRGEGDSDFKFWQPFIIYRCVVGSQAFGLSGDDSDVDRRGIYLPPAELHWSLYGVPEQIENNDTGRDAMPRVRDQGGAAAHALPPQDLRARGDCNARSAQLIGATDSQGLGSQIKWKHAMHLGNCEFRSANVERI